MEQGDGDLGQQINMNDWTEFWCQAQRTARYWADKSREVGLSNFEFNAYSKLCYSLERFYFMTSLQLDKQIEQIEQELEQLSDDEDFDGPTNQSPI